MPKHITLRTWVPWAMKLHKQCQDPSFMERLRTCSDELCGYTNAASGRITYNKVVNKNSFNQFSPIITAIAPLDKVTDASINGRIPSLARVIKQAHANIYPYYLYQTATLEEPDEFETEQDQEYMDRLIEYYQANAKTEPLIGLCILQSEHVGMAHAIAFVLRKKPTKKQAYRFFYFDPLAYRRIRGDRPADGYEYANRVFTSNRFQQSIEFIDLSQYCYRIHNAKAEPEKAKHDEYHCMQYVMNAEYCFINSLYFLTEWLHQGQPLHKAALKRVVEGTYIVAPSLLTRANSKESLTYRVVMMSFVMACLKSYLLTHGHHRTLDLNPDEFIKQIDQYNKQFEHNHGITLLPPK